ncbi:MAG: imelysin family protein [Granulosicoccus sp.]
MNTMLRAAIVASAVLPVFVEAKASNLIENYADIAKSGYEDSLYTAQTLLIAVNELIETPSDVTLSAARSAWLAARVPYQQTEVYRFGNALVDEWEGRVNAWPLDEGLIDYIDADYYGMDSETNDLYTANVIANAAVVIGGREIDASRITPELLKSDLHEAGGNEANVATGYHAIEFLLWGQDLHGTDKGAGERSYTDFDSSNCSNKHCQRRGDYLQAATALLVDDLQEMVSLWSPDGEARSALEGLGEAGAVSTMLTGMGSLSYGELAGERMRLGLMLHDPEEEHDCFSDNTHNSHFYDALGIRNVYLGQYQRVSGKRDSGQSLSQRVAAIDEKLDVEMKLNLDATQTAMQAIVDRVKLVEAYDQMIGENNETGNAVVQAAVDALVTQTKTIERIVSALGVSAITIEGSDSLDNPDSVFQ